MKLAFLGYLLGLFVVLTLIIVVLPMLMMVVFMLVDAVVVAAYIGVGAGFTISPISC